MSYTPGPWNINRILAEPHLLICRTDDEKMRLRAIAELHGGPYANSNVEDDAALICAAPDLLEVANDALRYLFVEAAREDNRELRKALRSVIDNAEGRSEMGGP